MNAHLAARRLTIALSGLAVTAMAGLGTGTAGFLAVSGGFGDQVCVVSAWWVDEGVRVSLAA